MTLLELENVTKEFGGTNTYFERLFGGSETVTAVDDISLEIQQGETYGLVGESGAGKSTVANLVTKLHEPTSGTITFEDKNITTLSRSQKQRFHQSVQMVFQTPSASIDPKYSVGDWIEESLIVNTQLDRMERKERVTEALETVNLSQAYRDHYPDELSGGELQRVSIATAFVVEPDLVILDEPVSALDKTIQRDILELLVRLQDERNVSYLLISHDLSVIQAISDTIGVMYLGELVEEGPATTVFDTPRHPYTEILIDAIPSKGGIELPESFSEEPPSATEPPAGCSFHPRCPYATTICESEAPQQELVDGTHKTSCHHWDELQ